jgi:hypothetical protein
MDPKLTEPPFVQAEGVINLRDAGGQPSHLPSHTNDIVKLRYLYRAGEPSRITPKGIAQLRDELGVRKVFDLRSELEVKGYKADPLIIEGVGFVKVPVSSAEGYDPFSLARRVMRFQDDPLEVWIFSLSSQGDTLTPIARRLSSISIWKSWRGGRTLFIKS